MREDKKCVGYNKNNKHFNRNILDPKYSWSGGEGGRGYISSIYTRGFEGEDSDAKILKDR